MKTQEKKLTIASLYYLRNNCDGAISSKASREDIIAELRGAKTAIQKTERKLVRELGVKNTRLMLAMGNPAIPVSMTPKKSTKKALNELLKERLSNIVIVDHGIEVLKAQARQDKTTKHYSQAYKKPTSPERLAEIRTTKLERAIASRMGAHYEVSVHPETSRAACFVKQSEWSDKYSNSCKYKMTRRSADIHAALNLHRCPLVLGGLVTLWSHPAETELQSVTAWQAVWSEPCGKVGWTFRTEGYIVKIGDEYAHGSSVTECIKTLNRRAGAAKAVTTREKNRSALEARLDKMDIADYADIPVCIEHSIRAGNCEAGTLAFLSANFPNQTCAPLKLVLSAARDEKNNVMRYAIAACIVAIHRHSK